jgi:hypothetical protein
MHDTPLSLLPQNLLDLTDLSLNFAGYLFTSTFSFQLWIIAEFPGDLLDLTLHFVKLSFLLVPNARFHDILLSDGDKNFLFALDDTAGLVGTVVLFSVVRNRTPNAKTLSRHKGNDRESIGISQPGLKESRITWTSARETGTNQER